MPPEPVITAAAIWPVLSSAAFLLAFVVSLAATPLADRVGRRLGMMDDPGLPRKVHNAPTPRSGGLAVVASFYLVMVGGILAGPALLPHLPGVGVLAREGAVPYLRNIPQMMEPLAAILLGGIAIFLLGFCDDRRPLRPGIKLLAQIVLGFALWVAGVEARAFLPEPMPLLITVAWIVMICNAINFLDNMNGLASGVAVIAGLGFYWQSWTSDQWLMMASWATLCGAIAGFWAWNFTRGRPFLGDGGSLFIGFMLAAFALRATYYKPGVPSALPVLTPIILLGVPLFDTATVMFIRWREGRPLMTGDRCHLSHRLESLGVTRRGAVIFHYVLSGTLVLLAWALRFLPAGPALALLTAILLLFLLLFLLERAAARKNGTARAEKTSEVP